MRAAFVILLSLLAFLLPEAAFAAYEDSRSWFEGMTGDERSGIQGDLILLGHYKFLVDGQFGHGTFDAIKAFQLVEGQPDTGVLTADEQTTLRQTAGDITAKWQLAEVHDANAGVDLMLPTALLPLRQDTQTGTSYASQDGQFSLETSRESLADQSFADLYDDVTHKDRSRHVTYKHLGDDRFVVTGTYGKFSYYTMFVREGVAAVGYSLAWGSGYAQQGQVASIYLASHFDPVSPPSPGEETKTGAGPGPAQDRGDFVLPADRPDVIALDAEITDDTPDQFSAALKLRPRARIVVLNSPGGGVDSALIMAREIHERGLSTYIPPKLGCYSACAYMFFGGVDRRADGELGVHQIYADVADVVLTQTTLGDVLDTLQSFGVVQPVISHMLKTPPDDMYVFSQKELDDLAINHGPPIAVEVALDEPLDEPAPLNATPTGSLAFVQLSSQSSEAEAQRSLGYVENRWGKLFGDDKPEVTPDGTVFRVRVPTPSLERANSICSAIKSDGGGCYVTAAAK